VEQAMQRLDQLRAIKPDTPVSESIEIMDRQDVNELPVVDNGRIEGSLVAAAFCVCCRRARRSICCKSKKSFDWQLSKTFDKKEV
jgi:CBS domain-containing protein